MPKDEIPLYDRILNRFLKTPQRKFISKEKLADEFSVSQSVLKKNILHLQEECNIIESISEKGYCFVTKPDTWTMTDIQPNTLFSAENAVCQEKEIPDRFW